MFYTAVEPGTGERWRQTLPFLLSGPSVALWVQKKYDGSKPMPASKKRL